MAQQSKIIEVTEENLNEHPQTVCFINPKHEFYDKKIAWLKDQFKNGLKIKLLYLQGEKRAVGFVEYVPGEYCWRAVNAKGYMFIHCLWTNGKKYQHQGWGARLLQEVETDAQDKLGIAVVTSDNSFMANKDIFLKNGFTIVEECGKDQLLAKQLRTGLKPSVKNWQSVLSKYKSLTFVYSKQCPWVARFIEEVKPILKEKNIKPDIIELSNANEAQNGPSLYSVFNLIYNGKLLADRYISTTRFSNILKKELTL
jgi:hypothetical protein